MQAKVQAEARRIETERLRKECAAERNSMREAIRQALLSKQLPKSAQVLGDRNQVVVSWMGRSHTFHLPSAAFA